MAKKLRTRLTKEEIENTLIKREEEIQELNFKIYDLEEKKEMKYALGQALGYQKAIQDIIELLEKVFARNNND